MISMISFDQASTIDKRTLFEKLKTSVGGLSEKEASVRLKSFGKNLLPRKRITTGEIFLRQFKNAFLYLLIGASIISFFLGQSQQAFVILAIIFLTAIFGFFLEFRSQKAEEKLSSYLQEYCWVKRSGKEEKIDKASLVPGDLILLRTGDIVPADSRLIKQENLLIDESILTGESTPLRKIAVKTVEAKSIHEAKNILFAGTTVQSGMAEAIVFATGSQSQIGKISQLVSQTSSRSSFEKTIKSVSGFILKLTIIALLIILAANIGLKGPKADIGSLLLFTIALAVGIVPEALPVVSLFTMSLGALALSRKKVIVKRLTALEDLGNVQVLCVDKTGTLTENKLSVAKIFSFAEKEFWTFFMSAVSPALGDKGGLRSYLDQVVYNHGCKNNVVIPQSEIIAEDPFHPNLRRDRTMVKKDSKLFLISKGAPEVILKLCNSQGEMTKKKKFNLQYWQQLLEEEGQKGRRTYALAVKEIAKSEIKNGEIKLGNLEKGMTFAGFVSFYDPIKRTAFPAIERANKLGVMVKILTGDSASVAGWVAKEVGLIKDWREVIEGEALEKMNDEEFKKTVFSKVVFARVNPEQKYRIVQTLQEEYWTAFLGDGVNDAPSLKLANVSLAVDKAADAAKAAADVILLKKDLQVILLGVEQGRKIFSNVLKYIQYTLASNFGNSYSLALISLLLPFLPMLPTQILLVNLLSDFPLILVATDNVDALQIRKPVSFNLRQSGFLIVFLGFISLIFDFLFFAIFRHQPAATLQTLWFVESVLSENIFIFSIRSHLPFWKAIPPSLPLIGLVVITTITAVFIPYSFLAGVFRFAQPSFFQIGLVFGVVFVYFAVTEVVKIIYYTSYYREGNS